MKRQKINYPKIGVIVLFVLILIIGLLAVNDFGISFDEAIERNSSLITYKYIMPNSRYVLTDTANFLILPELGDYVYRYYGMALQELPVLFEHLCSFQLDTQYVYLMRHVYTFLIFYVSLIYFYFLLKECEIKYMLRLLGVAILFLSPRIFADAFYNIKDLPFLSLVIVNLYYVIRFIKYNKKIDALFLCFVSALCANIRIVGAVFFVIGMSVWMVSEGKRHLKKTMTWTCVMGGLCVIFYIMMMPALWEQPITGLLEILKTFSSYSNWGGENFYFGTWWPEATEPWHYLFVWIFISTPIVYTVFSCAGIGRFLYQSVERQNKKEITHRNYKWIMFLGVLIPIGYVLVCSPVIYNGWRHFYFVYPIVVFFAVDCLQWIYEKNVKWLSGIASALLLTSFVCTGSWMIKNHPYEYVYFNPVVRKNAEVNFDKDYWAVSEYDQMKNIIAQENGNVVDVYAVSGSGYYMLSNKEQKQIHLIAPENISKADYVIRTHWGNPDTDTFKGQYMFEKVNDIEVDGICISSLYQRDKEVNVESNLMIDYAERTLTYRISGIRWDCQYDETGCWIETTDLKSVLSEEDGIFIIEERMWNDIDNIAIFNGEQWNVCKKSEFLKYPDEYVMFFENGFNKINSLRIHFRESDHATVGGNIKLVSSSKENNQHVIKDVFSNFQTELAENIYDHDLKSRWTNGSTQQEGIYVIAELEKEYSVDGVKLCLGDSPWDYPTNLQVYISDDGLEWSSVAYQTTDNEMFDLSSTVSTKWLKFELGEIQQDVRSNWSIYEMELFATVR